MTKEQVLDRLRQETQANKILDDTMHVLAMRKRPRHNLTLDGLHYRMRKEGFNYTKKDYTVVFNLLKELGLAKVATNFRGEPLHAEDFRLALPLIGAAAVGQHVPLEKIGRLIANMRVEPTMPAPFVPPTPKKEEAPKFAPREPRTPRPYQTQSSRLILTVLVNDKPVNIPVPKSLNHEELTSLIAELWEVSEGLEKKYGK